MTDDKTTPWMYQITFEELTKALDAPGSRVIAILPCPEPGKARFLMIEEKDNA